MKKEFKILAFILITLFNSGYAQIIALENPVRIGIVGLTHGHARLALKLLTSDKVKIVGIAEPNRELAQKYSEQFGFPMSMVYSTTEEMIAVSKPQAVAAFNSTIEHLSVVEACAPKGIHVMVEKPLAVNLQQAVKMKELAEKYHIFLITNYETTWHPSVKACFQMAFKENKIGVVRKVVFHDGNFGTKESKSPPEFIEWLTDPVKNGGGAIMDFGCYGINIMTWLVKGQLPYSVYAETRQFKPDLYPRVDDDATIILNYPSCNCIIEASWNWAVPRKDMEIYGETGYIIADNNIEYRYRFNKNEQETKIEDKDPGYPVNEPFSYFASIVKGELVPEKFDCATLENNLVVAKILEAAIKSAKTGKAIKLQ